MNNYTKWNLEDWHAHSGSKLDLDALMFEFNDMIASVGYADTSDLEGEVEELKGEVEELKEEVTKLEGKLEDKEIEYENMVDEKNDEILQAGKNLEATLDTITELEHKLDVANDLIYNTANLLRLKLE